MWISMLHQAKHRNVNFSYQARKLEAHKLLEEMLTWDILLAMF